MKLRTAATLALTLALGSTVGADQVRLKITRDVGICAHPTERSLNTGGNRTIRLKGKHHYYLFDFETDPIADWRIESAWLRVRVLRGRPLRLALSTVSSDWIEGSSVNKPQQGSSCFSHTRYPKTPWGPGGGSFIEAGFNSPEMLWLATQATAEKDGWLRVPIDPRMIRAVVAGFSFGLAMGEESGQTFENHDIYSRHGPQPPELIVIGTPRQKKRAQMKRPEPRVSAADKFADYRTGAIWVDPTWPGQEALAHRIHVGSQRSVLTFHDHPVLIDHLPPDEQGYRLRVETLYEGGIASSEETTAKVSKLAQPPQPPELARRSKRSAIEFTSGFDAQWLDPGQVLDPTLGSLAPDRPGVALSPRGAWASMPLALAFIPTSTHRLEVRITPPTHARDPQARLEHVDFDQAWAVRKGNRWVPEVCIPRASGEIIDVPLKPGRIEGQCSQTFHLDIWVPVDARPGRYTGKLEFLSGRKQILSAPIELDVSPVELPDEFNIVGGCNTYASPARYMGLDPEEHDAFWQMEREYFRLAHKHRTELAAVPYRHAGKAHPNYAPPLAGRGGDVRVASWEVFDKRFGPLLSGQAFSARAGYVGPGEGRGVDHFYLPLHENWPLELAEHFQPWPAPRDYKQFLEWTTQLPPIQKSFDESYRRGWLEVLKQFRSHLARNGWTDPDYHVYFNNKHYYRKNNGTGVSLWLLDEPQNAYDFAALSFFAELARPVTKISEPPRFEFRVDISRPAFQRDWMDAVVDLNVCAGQLRTQARQIALRRHRYQEEYWNYSMPGSFGESHLGWILWPIRSYSWAAPGTVVWQTIGSDGDLEKADDTALMVPGRTFGINRPLPTLRMKHWRDGIQVTELLHQLRTRRSWSDNQLRAWVGQVCRLEGWDQGIYAPPESSIVTFAGVKADKLGRLKQALLEELSP